MTIIESEERIQLMEAQLAVSDSAEEQKVLRKRIAYLRRRIDSARYMEKIDPLALPPDGESITFKTDGKGSISEFRSDKEFHYGADRKLWPFYIQPVFEHMYSEGWALTTPRAWIVKVEDLKRVIAGDKPLEAPVFRRSSAGIPLFPPDPENRKTTSEMVRTAEEDARITSQEWRRKALAGLNDKTLPLPKVW